MNRLNRCYGKVYILPALTHLGGCFHCREREKRKLICVLNVYTNRQDSTNKKVAAVVKRNLEEKAH